MHAIWCVMWVISQAWYVCLVVLCWNISHVVLGCTVLGHVIFQQNNCSMLVLYQMGMEQQLFINTHSLQTPMPTSRSSLRWYMCLSCLVPTMLPYPVLCKYTSYRHYSFLSELVLAQSKLWHCRRMQNPFLQGIVDQLNGLLTRSLHKYTILSNAVGLGRLSCCMH